MEVNEIWKDIDGYVGLYQVSTLGRVKRLKLSSEKILNGCIGVNGYKTVHLSKNGKPKKRTIHQLVSIAFLNHKPCGMSLVINHIDFDKSNNNVKNLEIVTSRENSNLKHIKSSSKYVGVSWSKKAKKWQSNISVKKKMFFLGYFNNEIEASKAYQKTLKKYNNERA